MSPANAEDERAVPGRSGAGISGNPAAANETPGTGWLGRQLGLEDGVRLGGVWIGAGNYLMSGGVDPGASFNSELVVDLLIDLERMSGLTGTSFGAQFLRLDTQPTNEDAGSVLGYNGLDGAPPRYRSQLTEIWLRQELFDERLIVRVGKSNPGADFTNVVRPIHTGQSGRDVDAVTGLLYGPILPPATLYGVLPGYYDTAYGVTSTFVPNNHLYVSYAVFDGNQARGVATGLTGPEFNGYYFHIAESGVNWLLGPESKPGTFAVGGWLQTGKLTADNGVTEDGATGFYAFGSQLLWYRDPEPTNSASISAFFQFGWNHTKTLPVDTYVGAGLTFRSLMTKRPDDSFGIGMAWGWLEPNAYEADSELMLSGARVGACLYGICAELYPDPRSRSWPPGGLGGDAAAHRAVLAFAINGTAGWTRTFALTPKSYSNTLPTS